MLFNHVRYAIRNLWHSKAFATVAILCLGFGIGLNATIFSIIDGVLLKPYPYTDPERIFVVGEQKLRSGGRSGLSFLDMRDWKEANATFTTIAAVVGRSLTIADGRRAGAVLGAAILDRFFAGRRRCSAGFRPRTIAPDGRSRRSATTWTRRYSDPQIGQPIRQRRPTS